jgi:predicted RNA-binding Zn-ribbon protein involved in translation (DUF1610 family)
MPQKYPKELMEKYVAESTCVSQVIRKMGHPVSGGRYYSVYAMIKRYGLNTDHFTGVVKGIVRKDKLPWQEVLVLNRYKNGSRENVSRLRRAMIESGIPYKCNKCGNSGEWNGIFLVLEIDHKNQIPFDNTPNNVQFLCPNCHSQRQVCHGVLTLFGPAFIKANLKWFGPDLQKRVKKNPTILEENCSINQQVLEKARQFLCPVRIEVSSLPSQG